MGSPGHVWIDAASKEDAGVRTLEKLVKKGFSSGYLRLVVARIDPALDDRAALAVLVRRADLTRVPPTLDRMTRDEVQALVATVCATDQAYGMPRMEVSKARRVADAFTGLFPGDAAAFFALTGFTRATFDCGVAARDGALVAAFVVEDED